MTIVSKGFCCGSFWWKFNMTNAFILRYGIIVNGDTPVEW